MRRPPGAAAVCLLAGLAAAVAALSPARPALAQSDDGDRTHLRARIGLAADHPAVAAGWSTFLRMSTSAASVPVDIDVFLDGPRLGSPEALRTLSTGQQDMGFLVLPAYPDRFPEAALFAELSLIGGDALAAAAALTEVMIANCRACQISFASEGIVFLGTYSAAPYVLMSSRTLGPVDALVGLRAATPGSLWDRIAIGLGAAPIDNAHQPATALARGDADAAIDIAATLAIPAVRARVSSVLAIPLGAYRGASPFTVSLAHWKTLSVPERRTLMRAAAHGIVATTLAYRERGQLVLAEARAAGIDIVPPDILFLDSLRRLSAYDAGQVMETAAQRIGVGEAGEVLAMYRLLYDKYATLLAPLSDNTAAMADLINAEVFGRLDAGRYGLDGRPE